MAIWMRAMRWRGHFICGQEVGLVGGETAHRMAAEDREVARDRGEADDVERHQIICGGRMVPISGSRPTMVVSVWWRMWLHRQTTGFQICMKLASW